MFGLFKPSPYAVAIRESMEKNPEKWTMCHVDLTTTMTCGEIVVCFEYDKLWLSRPYLHISRNIDRRTIRAGVEAWVVRILTQKEKPDGDV